MINTIRFNQRDDYYLIDKYIFKHKINLYLDIKHKHIFIGNEVERVPLAA